MRPELCQIVPCDDARADGEVGGAEVEARGRGWRRWWLGRGTIGFRLALLILIAALPVLVLEIYRSLEWGRQRVAEIGLEVERAARLIAAEQDQYFENARTVLAAYLQSPSVSQRQPTACSAYLTRLSAEFPTYTGLGAADRDGTIFCSSNPQFIGFSVAERDYFQAVLERRGFAVGRVMVGVVSQVRIVGMAYPRLDPEGEVSAVGVLGLDLLHFSHAMSPPGLRPDAAAVVLDGRGTIMARTPDPEQWIGGVGPAGDAPRPGGTVAVGDVDGIERLYAFTELIEGEDIVLGVGIPLAPLRAEAQRELLLRIAPLLAVFLGAAGVAWMVGELAIRQPLEALQGAIDRVAAGDLRVRSDRSVRVPEFVRLGRSFDAMADSLERHERELQRAVADKEVLVLEMNHRIKNSLHLVASMLAVQGRSLADPAARRQLAEAQARVLTVAQLHQRLYQADQIGSVNFGQYLRELGDQLVASLGAEVPGCELVIDAADAELPVDQVVPLGLIANELITNAYKYAYPAGATGRVQVTFRSLAEGGLRLEVADEGVGLPASFEPGTEAGGIGLRLIASLAQQLDAELEVDRSPPGCRFIIRQQAQAV
jgi:two-component sensor histidine kinase